VTPRVAISPYNPDVARVWGIAICVLSASCSFDPSGADGDGTGSGEADASPGDLDLDSGAGLDGTSSAEFDCAEWTATDFSPCTLPDPVGDLDLTKPGTYTFDTDGPSLTDPDTLDVPIATTTVGAGPEATLVVATSVTIGMEATLRVTGTRPLIIASRSDIQVDGVIDVGSSAASGPGAGANTGACSGVQDGFNHSRGGGGGGGGGLGAAGGRGGAGDLGGGGAGGAGGNMTAAPTQFFGGCPGGEGGIGDVIGGGGDPGDGGGAIELAAFGTVRIDGVIAACGGEGRGAVGADCAGGGGGSGGMIALDAPSVVIASSAVLAANGGGGGEGSGPGQTPGGDGEPGQHSASPASGGAGASGANGGPGGALAVASGGNGIVDSVQTGGGGGGGAVGYVRIYQAGSGDLASGAIASPAPQ
jgi:hypothetical protein